MSDGNLYISNGTCFFAEGEASDPRFIPCGNAAIAGTQACCFEGDFCLDESVCYDNDTSVTYITGCTDGTYSDARCPHKAGYLKQQWVALARCDGADLALFSGCAHQDDVVIEHEDCTCDPSSALVSNTVSGASTLAQIALLPTTAGGTISFNPTAVPTAESTSGTGAGSHQGLSAGARVGVGVGVGVGVPLIAAFVFAIFFFLRRRRRGREAGTEQQQQYSSPPPPGYSQESKNTRHKPELDGDEPAAQHAAELGDAAAKELSADTRGQNDGHDYGGGVNTMNSIQVTPHEYRAPSHEYQAPSHENRAPSHENRDPSVMVPGESDSQRGTSPPALYFISPQTTGNSEMGSWGRPGAEHANMEAVAGHGGGRQYM
ncbi:hypothetical protein GGR56DRAFT_697167 [Xylariaceae sp. FL0804]|nr:hypothetical protein GGR56DRAFT_697167 [Xylariaceae sp. FL0804]